MTDKSKFTAESRVRHVNGLLDIEIFYEETCFMTLRSTTIDAAKDILTALDTAYKLGTGDYCFKK